MPKTPQYRLPGRLIAGLAWAGLTGRQRSFVRDARWAVGGMQPQPRILGAEHIPPNGPCLVLCNHYSRAGLGVWWGALALSAAIAERRAPDAGPLLMTSGMACRSKSSGPHKALLLMTSGIASAHKPRLAMTDVSQVGVARPRNGPLAMTDVVSAGVAQPRDGPLASKSEIHWVVTAAWTFPESRWKHRLLTPITRWAFARAAQVYGFIPMPPMPPDPHEVAARAAAVLRTVRLARQLAPRGGMIGLAPEGRDVPGEFGAPRRSRHRSVGTLPAGAGAFVALLVEAGLPVLPVGIGERRTDPDASVLCVSFGPTFTPHIPAVRARRDNEVSRQVVSAIQRCIAEIRA